jgi:hypothetical protein
MPKYQVYIEEVYSGYVEIEADSASEADDIARAKTCSGEINPPHDFDGNTYYEVDEIKEEQNA